MKDRQPFPRGCFVLCLALSACASTGHSVSASSKRQDNAENTYKLGLMQERGEGLPKNEANALALYIEACHLGHRVSCEQLARFGDQAVQKLREGRLGIASIGSCTGGSAQSCYALGAALVAQSLQGAFEAFGLSCRAGSPLGCHALARVSACLNYTDQLVVLRLMSTPRELAALACSEGVTAACKDEVPRCLRP